MATQFTTFKETEAELKRLVLRTLKNGYFQANPIFTKLQAEDIKDLKEAFNGAQVGSVRLTLSNCDKDIDKAYYGRVEVLVGNNNYYNSFRLDLARSADIFSNIAMQLDSICFEWMRSNYRSNSNYTEAVDRALAASNQVIAWRSEGADLINLLKKRTTLTLMRLHFDEKRIEARKEAFDNRLYRMRILRDEAATLWTEEHPIEVGDVVTYQYDYNGYICGEIKTGTVTRIYRENGKTFFDLKSSKGRIVSRSFSAVHRPENKTWTRSEEYKKICRWFRGETTEEELQAEA